MSRISQAASTWLRQTKADSICQGSEDLVLVICLMYQWRLSILSFGSTTGNDFHSA